MKIAVCGRMRSGKDTLANRLVEEYGFKEFKFSQGINEIINKYFPEHAFSEKRPRKHQQFIGQGMRQLDKDVWVNYTLSYVEEYLAEHGDNADVVISDLRQENEARILRQNGFTIVNVYAFDDIRLQRIIVLEMFLQKRLSAMKQRYRLMISHATYGLGTMMELKNLSVE